MAIKSIQEIIIDLSKYPAIQAHQRLKEWTDSIVDSCADRVSIYCQEVEQEGREVDAEELESQVRDIKEEL